MDTKAAHTDMLQFVTFNLGKQKYAIDILKVQEINNLKEITPIPNAPPHMEGAINLRGKVIPVLNLRRRLHLEGKDMTEVSKIVIVDLNGLVLGMVVDSVSDVLRIPADIVEAAPPVITGGNRSDFVLGIAKLSDMLVIILDMDKMVDRADLQGGGVR
ncbi:MAG: chemotaxis protein CheW [Methylococcaceae bacterium]|nr:chemotaxis protein CheW [Methylococcaceae bacterium]